MNWVPHIHCTTYEGHFVLMAQPIAAINPSKQHVGQHQEGLLRMRAKDGDLTSLGSFLPAAERYEPTGKLDRWAVEQALEMPTVALARDPNLATVTLGIEISGAVLTDPRLPGHVKETLAACRRA